MPNMREKGSLRLPGLAAVSALAVIAAFGYSNFGVTPKHVAKDVKITSLTFKEPTVTGGEANPVHLEIAFTGTPGPADVVRIRPEKDDATGWKTTEPAKPDPTKAPEPGKAHVAFNLKDDKGPYIDVPITGTSPVKVTIETANPDMDRKDTFVTGKIGDGDGVDSTKITIAHGA
jgi:hypothetical protein